MKRRCQILILLLLAILSFPAQSIAPCPDPTLCFCRLVPGKCDVLVTAEVVGADDQLATIKLLDEPHYDPDQVLENGQIIENLESRGLTLVPGDRGLFLIHPPGACVDVKPEEPRIRFVVLEEEGLYFCEGFASFPGTTGETAVSAVLSPDCRAAVGELGIEYDFCKELGGCGCNSGESYATKCGILLAFLGLALFGRKRR